MLRKIYIPLLALFSIAIVASCDGLNYSTEQKSSTNDVGKTKQEHKTIATISVNQENIKPPELALTGKTISFPKGASEELLKIAYPNLKCSDDENHEGKSCIAEMSPLSPSLIGGIPGSCIMGSGNEATISFDRHNKLTSANCKVAPLVAEIIFNQHKQMAGKPKTKNVVVGGLKIDFYEWKIEENYVSLTSYKGSDFYGNPVNSFNARISTNTSIKPNITIKPSFDCNKASLYGEKIVCKDASLAYQDNLISALYSGILVALQKDSEAKNNFKQSQTIWMKNRNKCTNTICIDDIYRSRSFDLKQLFDSQYKNNQKTIVGTCLHSKIMTIEPRLNGADYDMGVIATYENGNRAISYEPQPELIKSKHGDGIIVCLKSLPSNCPVGDNRGAIYFTHNLRTGENWLLPADQHSCGGA